MSRFFKYRSKDEAECELRANWKYAMLLRYRLRYEEAKSESIWNLVSLSAGYLEARDQGLKDIQSARLKQINKWVASFEGDARSLSRYYAAIDFAKGYLIDNHMKMKDIHEIELQGQEEGKAEAIRRGYFGGRLNGQIKKV